ncbi:MULTISPECIES: MFS transporter [Ramlibacter]|uniref:MFS transporter n=1 Tax=Ramlibacter pinisoli TaxID=2682844 RepID=A0A6N8IW44_9BURK|nr:MULTISPECIES: MFS transporter [Ramlibacter]MBA2961246.1 MFS transporter [Ramlibacter sp. CGMCC 1.13660]MVQ31191.1 MFS transporter [Ramlibacter pinisoli]
MAHSPAVAGAADARSGFLTLFSAVMLPMFLAAVDQTLLAAATPRIARDLGGLSDTSWIAVGYLLAATIAAPLYGRMGDRYGRRNVLLVALAVFVAGSLACGMARDMHFLIGARVLQGLGGGGLMVLSQSLIGELVPPSERPRYQGYFAAVFTVSSVGGPVIGGFVVNHGDWRWLFLVNLPLGLVAAWRVASLPRPARSAVRDAPYDPMGVVLFATCAASALLWLSLVGHRFPLLSAVSAGLLALAAGSGALLAYQQRRHPFPFLPLDVLRVPGVGWVCLSVMGFSGSMFALVFLLPIYLQVGQNTSATGAGLQLLPLTIGMVVGSTLNARFSSRSQRSGVLPPWGLGTAAVALFGLAVLPPSHLGISVAAALCGMGFGTVMPSAQIAVQVLGGRERLGAASALLSITRSTGAAVGTAAFGGLAFALLNLRAGGGEGATVRLDGLDPGQVTHAFHIVFGVVALYAAAGAFFASRAPRMDLAGRTPAAPSAD